ncbi:MAG: M12 family metallopeptidase [Verrucomicrobia bacterium]|nr:M12 family metallopeptidase [Verrucomicrobiota bacterium]
MNTTSQTPLRICFDRILPNDMTKPKVRRSALPAMDPDAKQVVITPRRMALINSRRWDKGFDLRCRFLGGSKKQKTGVIRHAEEWMKYANIKLKFVDTGAAEVRIAFKWGDGSWSAVGKDALNKEYFPKDEPTMNYGWLEDDSDDEIYQGVVLHEFGHALGCVHEHQSPSMKLDWNMDAVYSAFSGPPNNWSEEEINLNVLQKYTAKGMSNTIFDPESIMLYQFDDALFNSGSGTNENIVLSEMDKEMIGKMYPPAPAKKTAAKVAEKKTSIKRSASPVKKAAATPSPATPVSRRRAARGV